jgi:uncharacterized membrane protein YfcA
MTSDPLFWFLSSIGVVALGLSKGGFAGAGMIATPLVSLTMPPLQAAALLLPVQIVQDVLAVWMFRRTYSAWNLKVMLPGAFLGVGLAWILAAYVSDDFIRLMLGVVSIAFVLHAWFAPVPSAGHRLPTAGVGLFWGTCAAFSSAICQAGNPPFQVFVLRQNLDKLTYVGTFVVFFGVVNALKVIPYLALGQFSAPNFAATLLLIPLATVANYLGVWLVKRTPTVLFYRIAHILVFVVSLELVRAGALGLWRGHG